jgi:hypothetical protein
MLHKTFPLAFTLPPLVLLAAAAGPSQAAISLPSAASTYSQSFDSLATSGTANAWVNDSTLPGWSLFIATGAAPTVYTAESGGSNAGAFRSFGATGSTERALGGVASGGSYFGSPAPGALAGTIAVAFTNTSSTAFDSFTLSFDGEQWRNGGNTSAQGMVLQFGFGASYAAVSWTAPGGNFDWASPVVSATAAAVDGNAAGLVSGRGGTLSTTWAVGDTLWIRWLENNDFGNDHGLAIDNLSFSVTAVPEPGTWALFAAGLATTLLLVRRRA